MSRWWEPGSDVALLEPVGVTAVDFANALTALHRAGASAILDAASEHPLVDDGLLVTAMAQARAAFAPLLLAPIAKATGADVNYAGLLLAEVFDEAEVGALRLFQLAVARGVPRRAAAERVARVYGVPGEDLGRYARAATDPKAPPMLLADLGDETLFASIAARCEAEGPEPVAKAESRATRAAAQADQPRDHGAYAARIGGQSVHDWLAEQMTEERLDEEEKPAEPAAAPVRQVREVRQVRQVRGAALVRAAGARQPGTRSAGTREAGRRDAMLRKLAAATNASTEIAVPERSREHPAGQERPVPDWDQMYPEAPIADRLAHPVAVALPISEANTFFRDVGRTHAGDRVFRAGALVGSDGYAGEATREGSTHDAVVASVAATIKGGGDYAGTRPPYVDELTPAQLDALGAASPAVRETRLKEMKLDLVERWAKEHEVPLRELPAANELPNVFLYQAYGDRSSWVLVYLPPPARGDKRPLPNVATMSLPSGVRGRYDAGSRYGDETFTVDRHQPLVRTIPRDESGVALPDEKYYDVDLNVLRTIVPLRLGSEGDIDDAVPGKIGKAESRETRRAAQADQPRARGEYGPRIAGRSAADWLDEQMTADVEEQTGPAVREVRQVRQVREVRRLSPGARQVGQRGAGARSVGTRASALRPSSQRLLDAVNATPETYFDPLDDYTLATGRELTHKVGVRGYKSQLIGHDGVAWLANGIHRDAAVSKEGAVLLRADDDWDRLSSQAGTRVLEPTYIDSDADWTILERRLADLFYDEGVEAVTLERRKVLVDGQPRLRVEFAAARRKLPEQHAVRWVSGAGDEKALRLVPEGEAHGLSREHLHTLVDQMRHQDRDSSGNYPYGGSYVIVNPRVLRWRVERPD